MNMKQRVLRYRVFFQKRPENDKERLNGCPWILYMSFSSQNEASELLTSLKEKHYNVEWKLVDANCNEYI